MMTLAVAVRGTGDTVNKMERSGLRSRSFALDETYLDTAPRKEVMELILRIIERPTDYTGTCGIKKIIFVMPGLC